MGNICKASNGFMPVLSCTNRHQNDPDSVPLDGNEMYVNGPYK